MPPIQPPCYAVIFSSQRTDVQSGYGAMAELMERLAREQPGFLDIESVRDAAGLGITISYWSSRESIAGWKAHLQHQLAQERGRAEWYRWFSLKICVVEEARNWESTTSSPAS